MKQKHMQSREAYVHYMLIASCEKRQRKLGELISMLRRRSHLIFFLLFFSQKKARIHTHVKYELIKERC